MARALTDEHKHLLNDYDPANQVVLLGDVVDELLGDKADAGYLKAAADGAAADVTAESTFFENNSGRERAITAIKYIPNAALTAHASNYATLLVDKRLASDYTTAVPVASLTTEITGSGDWVAFTPEELTLLLTTLEDGALLTFEITKAASGVAVPAGQLVVVFD
jgi:hypothetical protein